MKTVEERFWVKVGPHDDPIKCWLWLGATVGSGDHHPGGLRYGQCWDGGRRVLAHRLSYEMHYHTIIPVGMTIDHVKARGCTSTLCVNPHHLEVVTSRVNTLRGETITANNAKKTHCNQGHPFNADNTYVYQGGRYCRICDRERHQNDQVAHHIMM